MPTPLPREPSGGTGLHQAIKLIKRRLRELRLISTPQYSVDQFPDGQALRFKQEKKEVGGGTTAFRGIWFQDQQYKEGDIVMVRGGIEGSGPEALGTFWCVRDHTSTDTNYPRELTEQQVDPVSGGVDDLWRTFAAGAWSSLTIRAFPIPVAGGPPIVLPAYTLIDAGRVGCFGLSGVAGIDGVGGRASGSTPGSGQWELSAIDLPAAEIAKWRLLTLCIGNEKFTAYFAMTEPKAVP